MSLVEFTRFMNDAAALEKTLRLLQGIAQLATSVFASAAAANDETAAQLVDISGALRKHFALGRRYFRIFKWIDCALIATDALRGDEIVANDREGVLALLNIAKWSYLGMFLLTEAFTIVDALGVRKFSWAPMFFVESMRFWFYSISCAIVLNLYDLYTNSADIAQLEREIKIAEVSANGNGAAAPLPVNEEGKSEKAAQEKPKPEPKQESIQTRKAALEKARRRRHVLFRQLVGASCDLLTPGAVVNYTPVSPTAVAITSIISSLISQQDIWRKLNSK